MKKFIIQSQITKNFVKREIHEIEPDGSMEVIIRKHKKSKTNNQREGFHVLLTILSSHTGYTIDELKTYIKKQVVGYNYNKVFDEVIGDLKSSEKYTIEEYSSCIEYAYKLGSDLGCNLPELKK